MAQKQLTEFNLCTSMPTPGRGRSYDSLDIAAAKMISAQADFGFSYRATAPGTVRICRAGREVVTLRAKAAEDFLAKVEGASTDAIQRLCAKVTGNYKRGNESVASKLRSAKGRDS